MTHPVLALVESVARARAELQVDPHKLDRLQALQRWQVERLLHTYADFHASAKHRDAVEFFADDLYGPHDYADRDRDLQRVLEPWQRLLPRRALQAVTSALELEALTQELDVAVVDALGERPIDSSTYAAAYRAADRHDDRKRQIALIVDCGKALDALLANPWVRRALRLAKLPARIAGVTALHDFLERGHEAFAKMGSARELLAAIEQRETALMNDLFDGNVEPFRARATHARDSKLSA